VKPPLASSNELGVSSRPEYENGWLKESEFEADVECVETKCQLDATEVFIADFIACSTCFGHHYARHQELKSIIPWLLPVVFRAVVFQVAGLAWS